jgi:acyl-CoA thioesterase-1
MQIFSRISFFTLFFIGVVACSSKQNTQEQQQTLPEDSTPQTSSGNVPKNATTKPTILFFGNSLTAGYGLDPDQAFPALIQNKLDSLGYDYQVINAGLSGETTASGNTRLDWVLERQPVDIFILELGANDGLRGINPEETQKNLESIIEKLRVVNPEIKIILAGMQSPPNMGPDFTSKFQQVFKDVAQEKNIALIPFLLEGVAGEPELNLPDGIHPTPEGHQIVAKNVWEILENKLENV